MMGGVMNLYCGELSSLLLFQGKGGNCTDYLAQRKVTELNIVTLFNCPRKNSPIRSLTVRSYNSPAQCC